jgi:deoxyribodipyrimidine photo-lyase
MRVLHWFRNDLRLDDNTALRAACACAEELIPVFVVDPRLVKPTTSSPSRLRFLEDCLQRLAHELTRRGCPLIVRFGDPVTMIPDLLEATRADLLVFNRDYSPYARARDGAVCRAATRLGVRIADYKDRVVFEPDEIRTGSGGFYRVYSPYRRAWWARWNKMGWEKGSRLRLPRPVLVRGPKARFPLAFERAGLAVRLPTGGEAAAGRRLRSFLARAVGSYDRDRDRPAVDGTSRLSCHLLTTRKMRSSKCCAKMRRAFYGSV